MPETLTHSSSAASKPSAIPAAQVADQQEVNVSNEWSRSLFIQCKLPVGAPDDPMESEADSMANEVMRMPEQNFIQRKCAHCRKDEEQVQRKPVTPFIQRKEGGGNVASDTVTSRINSSRGSGNSLDAGTMNFMESRFGTDFGSVKIHSNSESAQLNRELSAKAFTVGNDIYFNESEYSPGSSDGKHLLAHELTHTLQQGSKSAKVAPSIYRTCDLSLAYTDTTCQGIIQVGATTISPPIAGYYHLFILYTDNTGAQFYFRGGPENPSTGGYGKITTDCQPYVRGQIEYDPANLLEEVYRGSDACHKLETIKTTLNDIESWNIPYVPAGPNSNSVIATLLRAVGLPRRKPAVPTPGFDMGITSSGSSDLPQDRPTTIVAGLAGGNGLLLNAELQQRLHTFTPVAGGIPIPIPLDLYLGLYGMPDQNRAGGSLGIGTNLSLFNLPLGVHSPLGIQLGGGVTVGAGGIGQATEGVEVGGYGRAGVYTDISRFRVGAAYQYDYFHNVGTGSDANVHSFLLQFGYTL